MPKNIEKNEKKIIEKRLYDVPEFSEIVGLALGTTYQYIHENIIPAIYVGRRRMITKETLDRICTEGLKTTKRQREAK